MRLALVIFEGLEDVVTELMKVCPFLDVFFDSEFDASSYDAVIFASVLGGRGGDKLIDALSNNPNALVFCTIPASLSGMQVSRTQANRILELVPDFEGAIVSDLLSLDEKIEVLKMIVDATRSK